MIWPDFFVVAGHGTGLRSFLFYLHAIGLPCSGWMGIDPEENPWEAVKFVNSRKKRYKYAGISVDRALRNRNLFPGMEGKKKPVFQLVRDPVAVMASNINLGVAERLLNEPDLKDADMDEEATVRRFRPDLHTWFPGFFFGMSGFVFQFAEQLRSVLRYTDEALIEIFDTGELTEKGAEATLSRIRRHFVGGFYGERVRRLFATSFNSFASRVRIAPLVHVRHEGGGTGRHDGQTVWICPADLYAFHSLYRKNSDVGQIDVDGVRYVLFIPDMEEKDTARLTPRLDAMRQELEERIRELIRGMEIRTGLYRRVAVRPEDITAFLLENTECLDTFRRLWAGQTGWVRRLRPGLAESWTHTTACL